MSLKEQLKRLAHPVTSSYAVDIVRRKSLVYKDPSKVDTQTCYQNALSSFRKLCEMEHVFQPFAKTLFAETSCRLEMCNLLANEKNLLDSEIKKFLCFVSPHLKNMYVLHCLEWLVYKFQVHIYNIEDYLRCVMPYHETGLFAKCVQLLNFSTLSGFQWLKQTADSGKGIPRQQFVRLCLREPTLIPFLNSMILTYVDFCSDLPSSHLNDLTSFFLATVTAICDCGAPDKKLAKVLDGFQSVIHRGLQASSCPPFQSAACLVVLRFSLKLLIQHDLVLDWINLILANTRTGCEWESVRVVMHLMHSQRIPILPEKTAEIHSALTSKLSPIERALIQEEETSLINVADANQIASEHAKHSSSVINATRHVDVTVDESHETGSTKSAVQLKDSDSISILEPALTVAHSYLASIPEIGCCILADRVQECQCPNEPVADNADWLSNLLLFLYSKDSYHASGLSPTKVSKRDVKQLMMLLGFFRSAVQVYIRAIDSPTLSLKTPKGPRTRKSSMPPNVVLLETGIDHALPLILGCLSHQIPSVRVEAYNLISYLTTELSRNHSAWTPSPNISILFTSLGISLNSTNFKEDVERVLPDYLTDLLRGDSLDLLGKTAASLIRASVRVLFSQSLAFDSTKSESEHKFSTICWTCGLSILGADNWTDLVFISNRNPDKSKGWNGFLELIRFPKSSFTNLHNLCLNRLNKDFLDALRSSNIHLGSEIVQEFNPNRPLHTQSILKSDSPENQLISALYDLANSEHTNLMQLEKVLGRLTLDVSHFDHMLLKLDLSRTVGSQTKSLFARVSEAREARLRSLRQRTSSTSSDQVSNTNESAVPVDSRSEAVRLRFLALLLNLLNESIPRLQSKELSLVMASSNRSSSLDPISSPTFTKLISSDPNNKTHCLSKSNSKSHEIPVHDLITPLINHLISLLNQEQHLKQNQNQHSYLDSDTSESESDDADKPKHIKLSNQERVSLPQIPMDLNTEDTKTNDCSLDIDPINPSCIRTLLKQCVYRILVCIATILSEANKNRRPRKRRLQSDLSVDTTGLLCGLAAAQAAVDPMFMCLTVYPEWVALHQQVLICFVQLASMFPVALCQRLMSLVQWVASNRQLMRLDNIHSLSLLGRMIVVAVPALIRVSSNQLTAALNVLSLFVDGFPRLPNHLPDRRLALFTGLVRALAQVTGPLVIEESCSGSSDRTTGQDKSEKRNKKRDRNPDHVQPSRRKDSWLGSWLWVTSVMFLNKNWDNEEIADQVATFLIDLFGQFNWDTQVSSWCECFAFLQYVNCQKNSAIGKSQTKRPMENKNATPSNLQLSKRRRLNSTGLTSIDDSSGPPTLHDQRASFAAESYVHIDAPHSIRHLVSFLFVNAISDTNSEIRIESKFLWSLTSRAIQFLETLVKNPSYETQVRAAADDPLGLGAVYGRLVEQIVRLMIVSAAILSEKKKGVDSQAITGASESQSGLQNILIHVLDSVPGRVFVSMINDLFGSNDRALRRKALDLLAAKLTTLSADCCPISVINRLDLAQLSIPIKTAKQTGWPSRAHLDQVLESGLVQLTSTLVSLYDSNKMQSSNPDEELNSPDLVHVHWSKIFGSSFSRQSLACLRDLAKLLSNHYPGEFMRIMDILITSSVYWWPVQKLHDRDQSGIKDSAHEIRGSGLAESRSLACLFFVECLQRLPPQALYPQASATVQRLGRLLCFCLDHSMTSAHLSDRPVLSIHDRKHGSPTKMDSKAIGLTVGQLHSRDQHLQSGLTLLCNVIELAIVHRHSNKPGSCSAIDSTSSIVHWLQSSISKGSTRSNESPFMALLHLIFQLNQIDLAEATDCNPERSGTVLRQISKLLKRIICLLPFVADTKYLLQSVHQVIDHAVHESNWALFNGAIAFLDDYGQLLSPMAKKSSKRPKANEVLVNDLVLSNATEPDLLWNFNRTILDVLVQSANQNQTPGILTQPVYNAISGFVSTLPVEARLRQCQQLFGWITTSTDSCEFSSVIDLQLERLSHIFHIVKLISTRVSHEDFSELGKQMDLVDYFVLTFMIALGRKRKDAKKLIQRLNFATPDWSLKMASTTAFKCVLSALSCMQHWLNVETEHTGCLDAGGGSDSILSIPTLLISLLDVSLVKQKSQPDRVPVITDVELRDVLEAFLKAVPTDEAFLRPLGSALADRIMHANLWQTRLAAIRLLKFTFDQLKSSSTGDVGFQLHGVCSCLVSDALVCLSEALEDDRPEVEEAANRLFAELEQSGLTAMETNAPK